MMISTTPANRTAPGHLDNRERWVAARITASHLDVTLKHLRKLPDTDEENQVFVAAKHLVTHFQASCGVFIDSVHTATTLDELIDINNEFYRMAVAKS